MSNRITTRTASEVDEVLAAGRAARGLFPSPPSHRLLLPPPPCGRPARASCAAAPRRARRAAPSVASAAEAARPRGGGRGGRERAHARAQRPTDEARDSTPDTVRVNAFKGFIINIK